MAHAVKFAVSISDEDFSTLEKIRKREKLTRSGVVAEAIRLLKQKEEKEELVRLYEEGYRKHPENIAEIKAGEKAALDVLSKEDWE